MIQLREDIRADHSAPWRNKLDSLDLLPDYIRRKGMVLGFPQDVPKAEPTEPADPKLEAAPVAAPVPAPVATPAATGTPAETTP
jgi:hypothetical protein